MPVSLKKIDIFDNKCTYFKTKYLCTCTIPQYLFPLLLIIHLNIIYFCLQAHQYMYSITGGTGRLGLINRKVSSEMGTALLLTHSPYCSAARCSHSALIQTANTRQRTSSHQPSHRRYWLRLHQTYKYINRK